MDRIATTEKRKARLIDIAEKVGVSKAAVASVLTNPGRNNIKVSQETSEAIRRVARELNYSPNLAARTLAGRESMVIGALVDTYAPRSIYRILSRIEELAAAAGYRLMIGQSHNNVENMFQCYQNFVKHGIDGVICLAHEYPGNEDKIRQFFENRKNLVFLDKPVFSDGYYIAIERQHGIRQAVNHLAAEGYRRIGFLSFPQEYDSLRQRLSGYHQALEENSISFEPEFAATVRQELEGAAIAAVLREYVENEVIRKRLDAVIAVNDIYAAHLLRELLRRGIRVPEDVAVIGHDNDDFTEFSYPALTSIDQKAGEVGKAAFQMLWKQLSGEKDLTHSRTVTTELVIRESSCRTKNLNQKEVWS